MRYLVDGYNLLFFLEMKDGSLEEKRRALILFLEHHLEPTKLKVTLVFDSPSTPNEFARHSLPGLDLVYSDPKQSADECILEELVHYPTPQQIVVVTNDSLLTRKAKAIGAKTIVDPLGWTAFCVELVNPCG